MNRGWSVLLVLGLENAALAGVTAGSNLLQPIGSRAAAMGEAYAAAEDDVFGIHYNPAAYIRKRQAAMLYQQGMVEDHFGVVGVAWPLHRARIASTILYYDGGAVTLDNMAGETRSVIAQTDFLGTVSAAFSPWQRVSLGANLKYLRSTLVREFASSSYLLDLGLLWRVTPRWNLALVTQNLGTGLKYGAEAERLPIIARAGTSYSVERFIHKGTIAFDVVRQSDSGRATANMGLEYEFNNHIAFRGGYRIGAEMGPYSTGLGFSWENYSLDYANIPGEPLERAHRASFAVKF